MLRAIDYIVTAGGYIAGFLCLLLVAVVVYGVFTRYVLQIASDWIMEVSQYLFCGISLLATGYSFMAKSHVTIDVLRIRLSAKTQQYLELVQYPIVMSISFVLIWMGGEEFWRAFVNNYISESVAGLPLWPVWLTIPIGGILLLLAAISGCFKFFLKVETK